MKLPGLVLVLLLATLVPPPGHGARRGRSLPKARLAARMRPLRIVRSPQLPKLVRPVAR